MNGQELRGGCHRAAEEPDHPSGLDMINRSRRWVDVASCLEVETDKESLVGSRETSYTPSYRLCIELWMVLYGFTVPFKPAKGIPPGFVRVLVHCCTVRNGWQQHRKLRCT